MRPRPLAERSPAASLYSPAPTHHTAALPCNRGTQRPCATQPRAVLPNRAAPHPKALTPATAANYAAVPVSRAAKGHSVHKPQKPAAWAQAAKNFRRFCTSMHCDALLFMLIIHSGNDASNGGNDMKCNDNDHTLDDGNCVVCGTRWVCHEHGHRHRIVRTRWNEGENTCTDCGVEIFPPLKSTWGRALRESDKPFGYDANRLSVWVSTSVGDYAATHCTYPEVIDDVFHHRDCACGNC